MSRSSKQAIIGLGAIALVLVTIVLLSTRGAETRQLRADVLSTRRAEPGERVDITVSTRDRFGRVTGVDVDFGDGTYAHPVRKPVIASACRTEFAASEDFPFTHTYTGFTGAITVRAKVVSGGCGAAVEQVTAIRTIEIKPLKRS
jgi:hypothetical protein